MPLSRCITQLLLPVFAQGATILLLLLAGAVSQDSPAWSFLSVLIATLAGCLLLARFGVAPEFGRKAAILLVVAFLARVLIGVVHYLSFFDPNYFISPAPFEYLWDFQWMHESLVAVAEHYRNAGLSPLPTAFVAENKNAGLMAYSGILYWLAGPWPMNVGPWNALHSCYTAYLTGCLGRWIGLPPTAAAFALAIVAFQPFGSVSTMMTRDMVGLAVVVLAVCLVVATGRSVWAIATIPAAAALAYSVREPYLLLMIVGGVATILLVATGGRARPALILAPAVGVILFTNLAPAIVQLGLSRFGEPDSPWQSIPILPLRMLRAAIGPIPWTNVLDRPDGFEYLPVDQLQAVFNLTVLILAVPNLARALRAGTRESAVALFGVLFYLAGVLAVGIHMAYLSVGTPFLVLIAASRPPRTWLRTAIMVLVGFILLNAVYLASGFAGTAPIMSITGY